jgi:hypothetical protein
MIIPFCATENSETGSEYDFPRTRWMAHSVPYAPFSGTKGDNPIIYCWLFVCRAVARRLPRRAVI